MSDDRLQTLLEEAWTGGWKGRMSALSEAKAWALREAWREHNESEYGLVGHAGWCISLSWCQLGAGLVVPILCLTITKLNLKNQPAPV